MLGRDQRNGGMYMRLGIGLALLILFIQMAGAVDVGSGVVLGPTSGSNTSVNVSQNISVSEAEIGSTYITLWNATVNNSLGSVTCDVLNFTASNNETLSSWFPQISASSGNNITITSLLNTSCNAQLTVWTNSIIPTTPLITFPDETTQSPAYSYENGYLTLTVAGLPNGTTVLSTTGATQAGGGGTSGGSGGSGGWNGGGVSNATTNASTTGVGNVTGNASAVSNATTKGRAAETGDGTILVAGEHDALILGGIALGGIVMLVLGLRR